MYGKHFDSMYRGSMVGAGFAVFSLMGYVISSMKPDSQVGFQVELNVTLLATVFGEPPETIQRAIDYLCAPDPGSRTPAEEGRRLVQVGKFAYRVVNGLVYDQIRNEEDRREQNRLAQQRHREKKTAGVSAAYKEGEKRYVKADGDGDTEKSDAIAAERLTRIRFEKPTIEAIKLQAAKIGLTDTDAENFSNYYESNGWRVGKNPMKSWPHALTNWKNNLQNYGNKNTNKPNPRNAGIAKDAAEQGRETVAFLARKTREREEAAAHTLATEVAAP